MPRTILTALIFIFLLSIVFYALLYAKALPVDLSSIFNLSFSQRQYSNFSIEIDVKEFLLKSDIEKIILKSRVNYSLIVGEILLEANAGESTIFNFSGNIQKKDNEFSLIGRILKANINEINITGKGKEIKILNRSFDQILLSNFKIDYIKFDNVSGVIKIPSIEIDLENATLEIFGGIANLTYNKTIRIDGFCNQIKVNNKLLIASS